MITYILCVKEILKFHPDFCTENSPHFLHHVRPDEISINPVQEIDMK